MDNFAPSQQMDKLALSLREALNLCGFESKGKLWSMSTEIGLSGHVLGKMLRVLGPLPLQIDIENEGRAGFGGEESLKSCLQLERVCNS